MADIPSYVFFIAPSVVSLINVYSLRQVQVKTQPQNEVDDDTVSVQLIIRMVLPIILGVASELIAVRFGVNIWLAVGIGGAVTYFLPGILNQLKAGKSVKKAQQ